MESIQSTRSQPGFYYAQVKCRPFGPTKEAETDEVRETSCGGSGETKMVGAIKEVFFPEWLANTVVMKKKNGKWRVCIDFTNLN